MDKELLHQLETPCVVLDTRMAEENIKKMQAACDACGVKLRPHIKTHKMPLFAKMQLAAGADGVTCAKVGEAEVMADGGVDDIFTRRCMSRSLSNAHSFSTRFSRRKEYLLQTPHFFANTILFW